MQAQDRVAPGDAAAYWIAVTRLDLDSAEVLTEMAGQLPAEPATEREGWFRRAVADAQRRPLKYRLGVVAPTVTEVVSCAGGWLFARGMAGWEVLDCRVDTVQYRLSVAARAFKKHALAAARIPVPTVAPPETFRSGALVWAPPVDLVSVAG